MNAMNIPRHWVRAEGEACTADGRRVSPSAWGWSSASSSDAAQVARSRLAGLLDRIRQGVALPSGYAYGSRPVREEIILDLPGPNGPSAVVTRNRYGSLVLNCARALFLDIDLPRPTLMSRLLSLFSRSRHDPELIVLQRVRSALAAEAPGGSFRIYRTAAGFRVLATSFEFVPGSPEVERLMQAAGVDPAFVQLCRVQQSFRARLTPKPWRCGRSLPPGLFPRESPELRDRFTEWLAGYEEACRNRATCRFVAQVGPGAVHAGAIQILEVHDRISKASEPFPLA